MSGEATLTRTSFGRITIGGQVREHDVWILAGGRVKKRKKKLAKRPYGTSHKIGPDELARVCEGDPEVLFIGTGQSGLVELTDEGAAYLRGRGIDCEALPTPQVVEAYNRCPRRKAALIHVTC